MKKQFYFFLLGLVVLGGSYELISHQKVGNEQSQNPSTQMSMNLTTIVPQFIDDKEREGVPLSPDLKKIKDAVANRMGYESSRVILRAVTPGTVLVTAITNTGGNDSIFDLATQKNTFVSNLGGVNSIKINDTIVYIDNEKISYYKLGQSSFLPLITSELTPPETYNSGEADIAPTIHETHANKTITVSVYDSSQLIGNASTNDYKGFKKIREATFTLP